MQLSVKIHFNLKESFLLILGCIEKNIYEAITCKLLLNGFVIIIRHL